MTERTFFDEWPGREVDFAREGASTWTLTKVISEKNSQASGDDFYKHRVIGGAYGTFLCHDLLDGTRRGVMKIFMQYIPLPRPNEALHSSCILRVPFEGTEYAPAEFRASQASASYGRDFFITSQVDALRTLTINGCQSTPSIMIMKNDLQKETDPVPGGYILFILMNYLPGVQLSEAIFWGLDASGREQIRQAFKLAWLDCLSSGILPALQDIEHVFWDGAANKAYITSFRMSEPAGADIVWRDTQWIAWDMAKPQDKYGWYKDKNPHPDMSKWTL
ncbi:hypothetical protein ABOM_008071 [Aspergillus bombycis]|uniref:Uncharacterized protein n=1 Tax=Aspergillus bombycis TaxID=109264 RepID=A0A1F7ZVM0_9EURO|nr:hypothetical protein ABOM_008071 [Aspergillus bombycis]OGM43522.1 hypothetical protein ABOM_008071 [Aspergillus bombycis]